MKDKEILEKAIEIAIENGYNHHVLMDNVPPIEACGSLIKTNRYWVIIFSHDFAKSFFGDVTIKPLKANKDANRGVVIDVGEIPDNFNVKKFVEEWGKISRQRGSLLY